MLGVFENEKLIAAYPVTIGSAHTASPIGEWKVRGITKLPRFRYDKEMLEHGKRSGNFYMLPPGPRNPVGVMWIALNKKGIGIHGTDDPMVRPRNGRNLARAIPGARFVVVDGMGHDLPAPVWRPIIEALIENFALAG